MKKLFVLLSMVLVGMIMVACNGSTTTTTTTTTTGTTTSTTTTGTTTTTTTTGTTTSTTTTTEEPVVLGTKVFVHYNKTLAAVELYNLKVWGKDLSGNWPTTYGDYYVAFDQEDDYGVYATVDLVARERSTMGFGITPGTTWAPDAPQVDEVDLTQCNADLEVHIYMVSGGTSFTYNEPAAGVEKIDIVKRYVPVVDRNVIVSELKVLFDDFTRSVLAKDSVTVTGNAALSDRTSHLVVNYTPTNGVTADAAIYKAALAANTQGTYSYLALVMKSNDGASISELKLAFRLDDDHELLVVDFADLLDPDLSAMPELTSEYQTYIISIADTLDGKTFLGKGAGVDVAAGGNMVGFHLYADGLNTGTLEIEEIYYTSASASIGYESGTDTLIDNFQRLNVNSVPAGIYWCGSVGEIVGKWLVLNATGGAASYEDSGLSIGDYENIVLSLRALTEGTDLTVTPVYKNGDTITYGTPALLSVLQNADGAAIGTLGTTFAEVCINLAANGWTADLVGLKLELAEGIVTIDTIEYKTFVETAAPTYPELDVEDVVVWDGFNRETLGATTAWTADNPVALANGLYYIITYTNSETLGKLYIENNAVVFDCSDNADYINFVEASQNGNNGSYQYIVFKMKVDEGGSFDNFRFQTTSSGTVVWANAFYAAEGLSSFDSPYVSQDGWTYVVIDLAVSGFLTAFEEMTMYYSGTGRLLIDNVFFANKDYTRLNLEDKTVVDTFTGTQVYTVGADYVYNWIGLSAQNPLNQRYLVFVIKGSNMADFRFATYEGDNVSNVKYITDLVGIDGYEYVVSDISDSEYVYLAIDLVASGLNLHPEGIHLHLSGNAQVFLSEIFFADEVLPAVDETHLADYAPVSPTVIDGSAAGYLYTYIGFDHPADADYLVMIVKGSLNSIRLATLSATEVASGVVYLNQMIGPDGALVRYSANSTDYQILVIDLAASGLGTNVGAMHFHYGDDSATDILTIQGMYLLAKPEEILTDPASEVTVYDPASDLVIDASSVGYVYTYIGLDTPVLGQSILILTVKGELNWARFEAIHGNDTTVGVKWLADLKGLDGNPLVFEASSTEFQTLYIDLVASGIGADLKAMHFHYGDGGSTTDILTIASMVAANRPDPTLGLAAAIND